MSFALKRALFSPFWSCPDLTRDRLEATGTALEHKLSLQPICTRSTFPYVLYVQVLPSLTYGFFSSLCTRSLFLYVRVLLLHYVQVPFPPNPLENSYIKGAVELPAIITIYKN